MSDDTEYDIDWREVGKMTRKDIGNWLAAAGAWLKEWALTHKAYIATAVAFFALGAWLV